MHTLEHGVTRLDVAGLLLLKAEHLLRVHAKRVKEVVEEALLAVDEAPIDALARHEVIKLLLGELRPLGADGSKGGFARHAELLRQPAHTMALHAQARRQLRRNALGQQLIARLHGRIQIPGLL